MFRLKCGGIKHAREIRLVDSMTTHFFNPVRPFRATLPPSRSSSACTLPTSGISLVSGHNKESCYGFNQYLSCSSERWFTSGPCSGIYGRETANAGEIQRRKPVFERVSSERKGSDPEKLHDPVRRKRNLYGRESTNEKSPNPLNLKKSIRRRKPFSEGDSAERKASNPQNLKEKQDKGDFVLEKEESSKVVAAKADRDRHSGLITVEGSSVKLGTMVMPVSVEWFVKGSKKQRDSPEGLFKFCLDMCSKNGDLKTAIDLYDKALKERAVKFTLEHYNVLLYLTSSAAMGVLRPRLSGTHDKNGKNSSEEEDVPDIDEETKQFALTKGFEIYQQMLKQQGVEPNEATFTAVARLGVAKKDGDFSFEMIKQMLAHGISPRLRSYGPALFAFCQNKDLEKAYMVDDHMLEHGVQPEEPELTALLQLSIEFCKEDKIYSFLHRLRSSCRQVSESTVQIIEQWFMSEAAREVGNTSFDPAKIREASVSRGGGWHGLGWLGKGDWNVAYTNVTSKGVCICCGQKLVTIDLDPLETEQFAQSIASLAFERENHSSFSAYEKWLADHGPFEAIIDGANVGLHQTGGNVFSFRQLVAVASGLQKRSPSNKMPLIILHNMRTRAGPAKDPVNKRLIAELANANALYTTPTGSNDDWYWLYAAVKFKCLLVTNDEMRDHIFALLGNDFFPRWKERHQVRYSFSRRRVQFHMPPPFSIVIQEAANGSWHVPILGGDDIEVPRKWLCVTRNQN